MVPTLGPLTSPLQDSLGSGLRACFILVSPLLLVPAPLFVFLGSSAWASPSSQSLCGLVLQPAGVLLAVSPGSIQAHQPQGTSPPLLLPLPLHQMSATSEGSTEAPGKCLRVGRDRQMARLRPHLSDRKTEVLGAVGSPSLPPHFCQSALLISRWTRFGLRRITCLWSGSPRLSFLCLGLTLRSSQIVAAPTGPSYNRVGT